MFQGKFKKMILISLTMMLILGLAGCGSQKPKLEQIKDSGKIVLGISADYPPYEFHKEINGEDAIVGFDVEIAKQIAKDLGVELEIKEIKFDGLLAALKANKIDFIVSGMTPTPERKESVDFSKGYYKEEQMLLIRQEQKNIIKSQADLKGRKIGAQKSTVQEEVANKIEGASVKSLSKITDLVLELNNKRIDAIVLPKPVAKSYASNNNVLYAPDISFEQKDANAVAVNKGEKELVEVINQSVDKLIENNKIEELVIEAVELSQQQ